MKKVFHYILCISIVLTAFTSCQKVNDISKLDTFLICNNDISNYKIIYASPEPEEVKWENYYFGIDYEHDKESADTLKSEINSIFGVELEVISDTEAEISEYEILIGKTNRDATQELNLDKLMPSDRICQIYGNDLVICGGDYSSTYHCIDLLMDEFKKQAESGLITASLNNSFTVRSAFNTKNIALIGDEVFSKSTSFDTDKLNVSSVMQRLLWKDYKVVSYLEGDSTARSDLAQGKQYISTESYKNLIDNCSGIDAVIVNLGTFDLKYSQNIWDKTDDAIFLSSYKSIIEELHSNNPNLRFYICTTVGTNNNLSIINAQKNVYKALVDLNYNVSLINLDALMGKYIFSDSFSNEIYPKEFASAVIAKKIVSKIEE